MHDIVSIVFVITDFLEKQERENTVILIIA